MFRFFDTPDSSSQDSWTCKCDVPATASTAASRLHTATSCKLPLLSALWQVSLARNHDTYLTSQTQGIRHILYRMAHGWRDPCSCLDESCSCIRILGHGMIFCPQSRFHISYNQRDSQRGSGESPKNLEQLWSLERVAGTYSHTLLWSHLSYIFETQRSRSRPFHLQPGTHLP